MAEFDIGVCIFFLNAEKFLEYSLRSFMVSDVVKTIAVVEGCVHGYPKDRVTQDGLSTDASASIVERLSQGKRGGDKIVFEQVGWVEDKKDLQNRGFQIIRERLSETAIYMLAGADELYHAHELEALASFWRRHPKAKIVRWPFYHFWWRPDLVAVGSSWSVLMHRAYRRPGLPMIFSHHAAPPADCGRGPIIEAKDDNGDFIIHCYHYCGMGDARDIRARLVLYRSRDGHRLNVEDTWSHWQWGEPTQWTHGGGSVRRFDGSHPRVIEKKIWELTPRGDDGKLLPLPRVPWDEDETSHVVTPPRKIAVFFEGKTVPDDPYVAELLQAMNDQHEVMVFTPSGELSDASQHGLRHVRKFSARELNRHDLVVLFPESFSLRPLGARHAAVLWKKLPVIPDFSGYVGVFETPASSIGKYELLPPPADFVYQCMKSGGQVHHPESKRQRPADNAVTSMPPLPCGISDMIEVQLRNVTNEPWTRGRYFVGAFWCDGVRGEVIDSAVRTKIDLPRDVGPGETLTAQVPVPAPPIENGFLKLAVDLLDNRSHQWLGVGVKIPRTIRGRRLF